MVWLCVATGVFLLLLFNCLVGFGGNGDGGKTQTAGTVIQYLVPPRTDGFTRVTTLMYKDGGTAHTLTFLRPLGRTRILGAAASGQAVVNLTADPGVAAGYGGINNGIAANDFVAVREKDGVTRVYKVQSVATLAITLTTNLVAGCVGGESFWFFGITTDTDGRTGAAHPALLGGAGSSNTTFTDSNGGVVATVAKDEPILFNSNNATAAGTLAQIGWSYTAA